MSVKNKKSDKKTIAINEISVLRQSSRLHLYLSKRGSKLLIKN